MHPESEVYRHLAHHLDELPGGYPSTESGVELRILRRLFSPDEAALAMKLTLIPEEARVVALRAGRPVSEVRADLETMADKGLCVRIEREGAQSRYMALQFVIGIWEFQVNRLTPELIHDMEEYIPDLVDGEVWRKAPQLRTIPVGSSFDASHQVLPYEQAEQIIGKVNRIAVAPCICRRERAMVGEGCGRLLEACLIFGTGAEIYVRNGYARRIDRAEALSILEKGEKQKLVLQPGYSEKPGNICMCCGCCCGVLRTLKTYDRPSEMVSNPFRAVRDDEKCDHCGVCAKRCQTGAMAAEDDRVAFHSERCVGCGLCVSRCPQKAIRMDRVVNDYHLPSGSVASAYNLGKVRGKLGPARMAKMLLASGRDNVLARIKG